MEVRIRLMRWDMLLVSARESLRLYLVKVEVIRSTKSPAYVSHKAENNIPSVALPF
ncbi:MAG: hypothetical protein AB8G77_03345 [Rhodothermales bacterium]